MLVAACAGQLIPAQIAFGFDHFYQCGLEIVGQTGRLTTTRTFTAGPDVVPFAVLETSGRKTEIPLPTDNHFIRLLEAFARRVGAAEWEAPCEENLRQARLQDQVRRLAECPKECLP